MLVTARGDVSTKEEKGLWLACQSVNNSTGGRAHGLPFFVVQMFFCSNDWTCARRTTDRDLASVTPNEKEREKEKNANL